MTQGAGWRASRQECVALHKEGRKQVPSAQQAVPSARQAEQQARIWRVPLDPCTPCTTTFEPLHALGPQLTSLLATA